jgi:hypothetical protein
MSTLKSSEIQMNDLLDLAVAEGRPTCTWPWGCRRHAPPRLAAPLDAEPLTPEDTDRLMRSFTPEQHVRSLEEHGGSDFGFGFGDLPAPA